MQPFVHHRSLDAGEEAFATTLVGVLKEPSGHPDSRSSDSIEFISHECENSRLRNYEISVSLEGDLDGGFPEKQRVVASARLHRHEAGLARGHPPGLVDVRVRPGHRQT